MIGPTKSVFTCPCYRRSYLNQIWTTLRYLGAASIQK